MARGWRRAKPNRGDFAFVAKQVADLHRCHYCVSLHRRIRGGMQRCGDITCAPEFSDHTRITPATSDDASIVPSALIARSVISAACPLNVASNSPVRTDQT